MPISDTFCYKGAGLLVPVGGVIELMPGTCPDPAFRRIDVDVDTGKVEESFQGNHSRSFSCGGRSPLVQNRSPLFCNVRL